jgi:hypothetical protein
MQSSKWPASLCPTVGKKRIFYYLLSPHRNTYACRQGNVLNRKTNENIFQIIDILIYCQFFKYISFIFTL